MHGGDPEMPLFLEHNFWDLDVIKVILALMQNVALRVDMLGEAAYHLSLAGRIADVYNFHKHLFQL